MARKPAKTTLTPWQARVVAEKEELDKRIHSLKERLRVSVLQNHSTADGFDDDTTLDLFEQLTLMEAYSAKLAIRIDKFSAA